MGQTASRGSGTKASDIATLNYGTVGSRANGQKDGFTRIHVYVRKQRLRRDNLKLYLRVRCREVA